MSGNASTQLTLAAAQIGKRIKLRVTATNGAQTRFVADSDPTTAVAAKAPGRARPRRRSTTRRPTTRRSCDGSAGTWTGTQPIAFAFSGSAAMRHALHGEIANADSAELHRDAADIGIRCGCR